MSDGTYEFNSQRFNVAIRAFLADGKNPGQAYIDQHIRFVSFSLDKREFHGCFVADSAKADFLGAAQLFVEGDSLHGIAEGPAAKGRDGSRVVPLQPRFRAQLQSNRRIAAHFPNGAPKREEFSGRDIYFFLLEEPCRQTGAPKHRRQRYVMLLQPLCPKFGYLKLIAHDLSEAMSIEKRYFTSDLSSRSYASLTFWMGMTSTLAVMLWTPQKSSISCVSAMPPMAEPEKLRRRAMRLKAATQSGFAGAPTSVRLPSTPSKSMYAPMS